MNQDVFKQIVDKYSDMVTKICCLRCGNMEDAKDCYQNVFLKCYASLIPDSEEHIKAWLIRVAINECNDLARRNGRITQVPIEEVYTEESGSEDRTLKHYERNQVLKDCISGLRADYQNVIYLYYYEQYRIPEIAKITSQPENTIKTHLKRAKEQLAGLLTKEFHA